MHQIHSLSNYFLSQPYATHYVHICFKLQKTNPPSLKLALRTAVAHNQLHLDEPRKRTYHAWIEGQRKEEIAKTMSSFIPHLPGLKMKSENPIYLDELTIFIASHSMIFLSYLLIFLIPADIKIKNQAKKITVYLLDMFLLTFLHLYLIYYQISNMLEINGRHNICLYPTVVLFCSPENIRRDVHGLNSCIYS